MLFGLREMRGSNVGWSVITTTANDGTEVRLVGCRRCARLFQRTLMCLNLVLPHCGAEAGREDRNPGVCYTAECCTAEPAQTAAREMQRF